MVNDWPKRLEEKALHVPNPTPKPTAKERVVELTQALKVIDEMRRQNLARIDDAKRQAFEEVADYADKLAQESDTVGCGDIRDWCRAHALAKEQDSG